MSQKIITAEFTVPTSFGPNHDFQLKVAEKPPGIQELTTEAPLRDTAPSADSSISDGPNTNSNVVLSHRSLVTHSDNEPKN